MAKSCFFEDMATAPPYTKIANHLYMGSQKALKASELPTPQALAEALLKEERWRQVLSSLVVCFFARGVYTPEVVQRALAVAGFECSAEDLSRIGADTLRRKYAFKVREGFDLSKVRIPQRILETPSAWGTFDEAFLRQAMEAYVRGL